MPGAPVHPPHPHHYLVSRRGQFLQEVLPDGRTRLEGTTWYTNRIALPPRTGRTGIIHFILPDSISFANKKAKP
jgi:hypothetical protein